MLPLSPQPAFTAAETLYKLPSWVASGTSALLRHQDVDDLAVSVRPLRRGRLGRLPCCLVSARLSRTARTAGDERATLRRDTECDIPR
uniref:Uncharacterized protein n=1 Tax=Mycena chlorophos TaxID=658473 RepID=A0ABQ0LNR1_MYCCL|nr:predicted protein [Mycena chlorophos]